MKTCLEESGSDGVMVGHGNVWPGWILKHANHNILESGRLLRSAARDPEGALSVQREDFLVEGTDFSVERTDLCVAHKHICWDSKVLLGTGRFRAEANRRAGPGRPREMIAGLSRRLIDRLAG